MKFLSSKKWFFIFLMMPFLCFSQKIKTKKDKILLDDKEIGLFKEIQNVYNVYNLSNQKLFTAQIKSLSINQSTLSQWIELINADGSIKTEIPFDVTVTSFSPSRIVFTLLAEKYSFVNTSGFDKESIATFFDTPHESLSEKALNAKAAALAVNEGNKEKIAQYKPFVKDNFNVVFGGSMSNDVVGKVNVVQQGTSSNVTINVYDLDNLLVASTEYSWQTFKAITVKLFNNSSFEYEPKKVYVNKNDTNFLTELIEELVSHDVVLGHQVKNYKQDELKQKIAAAKERSVNVYNLDGHLKDEKGIEYKGKVTALFQKLDINNTGDIEVWNTIDNFGKKVNVTYLNDKGNSRTKTFDAKDNLRFYVTNEDGTETAYEGMKVNGDSMKKLSNAMSLGFNNAYFYREIYQNNGNSVLVDPIDADRYVIKLKSETNGQMLDERNNDKLSDALADYLKGCKNLSTEIRNKAFDLKIESNLEIIIKEYSECK